MQGADPEGRYGEPAGEDELRMVLVVRGDLPLEGIVGKMLGQAGHGFGAALLQAARRDPQAVARYMEGQTKIVVKCKNVAALLRAQAECEALGLNTCLVTDAGRTVFDGPMQTCLAVGPCLRAELPKFVQRMQLL